ncbi:MAG: beta-galactosidase [bacterium]
MLIILVAILIIAGYLFIGIPPQAKEIKWGVNFSQKHAQLLGLDWQETFLALVDDLGTKNIKVATYWDLIEPEKGNYNFEDLDWQIRIAEEKGVNLFLVIGMKTPRWPECHIPEWAKGLSKVEQQERILDFLEKIVLRYRDSVSINMWQVENEPFFPFGDCPWVDKNFLEKEIELVKSLDSPKRPVLISDSGEGSFWFRAAQLGDIVGATMYKKVWIHQIGKYFTYPLPPTFYWRKAQIIEKLFGKEVICVELQAEPWGPKLLYDSPLEEQEKTMNLQRFQKNIEFAKKTGLKEFYLWGGEWWYWMKEKQNNPQIWQEAKKLF